MRQCIAELVQAAEQLPADDVEMLKSMAQIWAARKKSVRQTDFLSNSSKRDNTLPASSNLFLPSGLARRK